MARLLSEKLIQQKSINPLASSLTASVQEKRIFISKDFVNVPIYTNSSTDHLCICPEISRRLLDDRIFLVTQLKKLLSAFSFNVDNPDHPVSLLLITASFSSETRNNIQIFSTHKFYTEIPKA